MSNSARSWLPALGPGSLALLPALTALGLAGLYAIGALLKTSELMGAGLEVRDTLPLIPLPQILATGIGTAAQAAVLAPVVAALFVYVWHQERRDKARRKEIIRRTEEFRQRIQQARDPETVARERSRVAAYLATLQRRIEFRMRLALSLLVAILLALALITPWDVAVSYFPILALTGFVAGRLSLNARGMYAVLLVMFPLIAITRSFIWPHPLPPAVVTTADGHRAQGALVAATDSIWYLKVSDHRVEAIAVSERGGREFASEPPEQRATLGELLADLF